MRHVIERLVIRVGSLALIVSVLTCCFSGQALSAAEQVKPSQPAQTQQWFPQTAKLVGAPSGSILLKGKYIELGMHTLGSFGAEDPAYFTDGFHPLQNLRTTFGTLGFIYNPLGWTLPTDRPIDSGDFFVPGVPEEVWGVSWNYGASNENTVRYMNAGLANPPLTSLVSRLVDTSKIFAKAVGFPKDISSGNDRRSLWQGTATHSALVNQIMVSESLRVTQTVHFDVSDKFFVINVVLTNTGKTTIFGLKYLRSVDPDQEAGTPVNGVSGATINYVSFQPPRGTQPAFPSDNTNKALVVAKGPTKSVTLGLGAIDSRARVAYSTKSTGPNAYTIRDPLGVLQLGTNADGVVMADSARADSQLPFDGAISLAFDLGDVPEGQSKVINYVYLVNESDLDVALGSLKNVSIVSPTGTVSGNNVIFQALVSDKSAVTKVDFFAGGTLLTPDTTATGAGTYETTFNTTSLPNGSLRIEAVATYADSSTNRASATVTVANAVVGPTVSFSTSTPADGATVSGGAVSVGVDVDSEVPPAQVIFYRDVGNVSTVLATLTQAPFTTSFSVTDLANNTSVTIRAVASNAGNTASTTISRTFVSSVPVITEVTAPVIPLSAGEVTTYTAVSPSTTQGITSLLAALSGSDSSITRAFTWDSTMKSYVELPTQPAGGVVISTGIFVATRVALSYSLSGTAATAPFNLNVLRDGWTFAGIPPVEVSSGTFATTFVWPGTTAVSPAVALTISLPGSVTYAQAMGNPLGDDTTSRPWFWNGSAYVQVDTLESGKGYWFKNNLVSDNITITVPSSFAEDFAPRAAVVAKSTGPTAFRDHGAPPPPPSGTAPAASSSSGGCGVGSGLASFAFLMLLFGFRFFVARR